MINYYVPDPVFFVRFEHFPKGFFSVNFFPNAPTLTIFKEDTFAGYDYGKVKMCVTATRFSRFRDKSKNIIIS